MSLFDVLRVFAVCRVSCFRALLALIAFLGIVTGASPRLFAQLTQLPVWTEPSLSSSPPTRYEAAMAYDAATGQVVLFGGVDSNSNTLGDTWTWNGSTWTLQRPSSSPPARAAATMAYDAATGQVVLFGGFGGTGRRNDTWTWNGSTWTQQSPSSSPLARAYVAMAYDAASGQVVLFGGTGNSGDLSDTWTWNGSTWTLQSPSSSPPARTYAAMAYDAASGQVVLFGGTDSNSTTLGDTWTWNGSTWTEQSPLSNPPVRDQAAMAYDAASGQVVLFGGTGNNGFLSDTWTWNGSTWTEQSPSSSPPARFLASMAYDAASGQVVLFGGTGGVGVLDDTWTLQMGPLNMGTANVCPTGATTPSPCSQSAALSFSVVAGTTIGSINILTTGLNLQATPNDSSATLCQTQTYSSAATCTVDVTFTPKYAGVGNGAVVIENSSGAVLATTHINGTGSAPQVALTPGTMATVAGNGTAGTTGNGGAAISAELFQPYGVADAAGNLYIADTSNNVIREVSAATGTITTVAGDGTAGYSGDNGAATAAELDGPVGVAVDGVGNLYIADVQNNRIREVNAGTGIITTVAGDGGAIFSGDGGPATSAELSFPYGVAVDAAGNLYIADNSNQRIREVSAATGFITTVAGKATPGYSGDGGAATSAELFSPYGVAVDGAGNLYIADVLNNRIREINAGSGIITTVAGNGTSGFSGDGGAATSAELHEPFGVVVDAAGDLYITDTGNYRIRKVSAGTGIITTVAGNGTLGYSGDGGSATSAELSSAYGIALDSLGNLYIADVFNNRIREVEVTTSPILTFATATQVGSTNSTDGPQSVTVSNIGNAPLTLPTPTTGMNPSLAAGFTWDSSGTCPQVSASSAAGTLASGTSCTLAVDFAPTTVGTNSGSLLLTDNNLNAPAPSYATQSITLSGTGLPATPPITWATPAAITYGTALTAAQLDATASVPGTFAYTPIAGTVLPPGSQTLSVTFTPNDTTDYTTTTATVTLTVNQVKPTITWATPAAITAGTPLGTAQLDATAASLAGTFLYNPAAGTVLPAGSQTLSVTFTPTDTTHYTTATSTVTLTVTAAPTPVVPTLTFAPIATQLEGAAPFAVSATSASSGAVTYAVTSGPATIAGNVVTVTGTGTVVLTATQTASGNYTAATATTSFSVGLPFTLTTATGTTAGSTESVASGSAASFNLTLTPTATTFPDAITFSVTGLPTSATATFSPATIAAGSAVTPVTLTIQTANATTTARNKQPTSGNPLAPVALGFLLLPLLGIKAARERLRQMPRLPAVLLAIGLSLGAALGIIGCSGGTPPATTAPAPQTYTVVVTATDSITKARSSTNLTLTVQ